MVKISSDSIFKGNTHVMPRGGRQLLSRWLKLEINNLHSHVDLISNYNVGNMYTDNQVYNKPLFKFKINRFGNVVVLINLC
jgi:hypothetical protein